MATFEEIMGGINQGLGGLNTPLGQLGTQLLMASGPQAGNPGGGARMGQAFVGMQQQQQQQQQMAIQNQLRQIQQQEMQLRSRALDRQDKQQQTLQNVLSSPEASQGMTPIQRQLMLAGYTPADIAKMNPQQKQATPPGMFDMPQPDGTYIRNVVNPETGKLEQSVPFTPPQAQTANVATQRLQMDQSSLPIEQGLKERTVAATEQNAATQAERVATQAAAEQRQQDASQMTGKFKRLEFKQAYRGAVSELGEVQTLANEIAKSPALNSLYGPNGYVPPVAGSDAADLQTKIDRLVAKSGLTELVKLKNNGVALTPVSNTDLAQAQASAINTNKLQSDVQARETFANYANTIQKAMDEAATRYNEYDSLYDVPGTSTPSKAAAPKAPAPGAVMDGYRYNGGDPASPQSWSKM